MAGLRVFVSSTCFDLGAHRDQLRVFLTRMGYEPVMSDYSDVLYDPKDHTHTSCIKEVSSADILILMIGSRFGGVAVADAIANVDFDKLASSSSRVEVLSEKENLSITQIEVLKAVEDEIPVFAFVSEKLYSEHHVYSSNRLSPVVDQIVFPSIDKPSTAKYIFGFIDFITHRVANNGIFPYRSFGEMEDHLTKQWSLLFARLLRGERDKGADQRRADIVIDQIEGLKAVVLQSISSPDTREVARGVIRFRRMVDFLIGLNTGPKTVDLAAFKGNFQELMDDFNVSHFTSDKDGGGLLVVLSDETFFTCRFTSRIVDRFAMDWDSFRQLPSDSKSAIYEGISSAESFMPIVRYHAEPFNEYMSNQEEGRTMNSIIMRRDLDSNLSRYIYAKTNVSKFPSSTTNVRSPRTVRVKSAATKSKIVRSKKSPPEGLG